MTLSSIAANSIREKALLIARVFEIMVLDSGESVKGPPSPETSFSAGDIKVRIFHYHVLHFSHSPMLVIDFSFTSVFEALGSIDQRLINCSNTLHCHNPYFFITFACSSANEKERLAERHDLHLFSSSVLSEPEHSMA